MDRDGYEHDHVSIAQTETVLLTLSAFSADDDKLPCHMFRVSVLMISTTLLELSVPNPVTDKGLSKQLVQHILHLRAEVYTQSTALLDVVLTFDFGNTLVLCHRAQSDHTFTWA